MKTSKSYLYFGLKNLARSSNPIILKNNIIAEYLKVNIKTINYHLKNLEKDNVISVSYDKDRKVRKIYVYGIGEKI